MHSKYIFDQHSRNEREGQGLYLGKRTFMTWFPIAFLTDSIFNATLQGSNPQYLHYDWPLHKDMLQLQ